MFFQGDLQSGILSALQSSKLVACLVTDAGQESELWVNEFLQGEEISTRLQESAVLLRLEAGSQEASYLSVFCAIDHVPTLVIIHNGRLQEVLSVGISRQEFVERIRKVLTNYRSENTEESDLPTADSAPSGDLSNHPPRDASSVLSAPDPSRGRAMPSTETSGSKDQQTDSNQSIPKRTPQSHQEASRKSKDGDLKYAEEQRKLRAKAEEERKRVLLLVENDRSERRDRRQQQEKLRLNKENEEGISHGQSEGKSTNATLVPDTGTCALQVRLLDGSTIRSRFSVNSTLRTEVRRWVDEERIDGDTPYSFKVIRAPFPNRSISITEEEESLRSLDLVPSATLVLTAVQKFSDAYDSASRSLLSRGFNAGYGVMASGFGFVAGTFGGLIGTQRPSGHGDEATVRPAAPDDSSQEIGTRSVAHQNIRTLRTQSSNREDAQLYNGNQLNFEPQKKDD
ncbi:hypothetical protein L228DRAFT_270575 [Xylona heveae TC161]|uniref:UBX domain-containing protein n=1 Tax=Xylona heveae (strain CBS 132557 / TC161) TaxID=1328760 RepID=A0A165AI09_XYLHT|nr:hypothetical protein L228DRAFT_270575 [Xylona heveae TC161]KZF20508.1 hypothetical protein L228DRAFT_270575 [Xylona heveae TC161]